MNRKLLYAIVLISALNLFLLFGPFLTSTWDSETHLFFADHYRRGWFDPWEEKWFEGFWVYSYPPLAHQLTVILAFPFGLGVGYKIVQGLSLLAFPWAMWLFAREVVGERCAGWAALLSTTVPGIYTILYTFGQLPSFLAMVLVLIAGVFLTRYLESGRPIPLLGWIFFAGAAAATHHHTVLVILPMMAGVLVVQHWIVRPFSFSRSLFRPVIAGVLLALAVVIAIAPFWWWFFTQNLPQVEIPHPARENIFRATIESEMFFWNMYGGFLLLLPLGLWSTLRRRDLWPLGILIVFLGVLGLGELTSLPGVIFRGWSKWLTYERFTVWAVVLSVIPISIWLERSYSSTQRYAITVPVLILLLVGVVRAATFSQSNQLLPRPLERWEEVEIIKFLEEGDHPEWNYLTLGLGEAQFARLSRLTSARTVDGTYYTARWRAELRKSGIGTIDASFWWGEQSYALLFPMLQHPWDWNLKWAIVTGREMEEHLRNSGWETVWSLVHPIGSDASFEPGDPVYSRVTIWQVPNKIVVPKARPGQQMGPPYYTQSTNPIKRSLKQFLPYLWGLVPLAFLVAGLGVIYWSEVRKEKEDVIKE